MEQSDFDFEECDDLAPLAEEEISEALDWLDVVKLATRWAERQEKNTLPGIDARKIYLATRALGEYCVGAKIESVLFIDVRARAVWAGLNEYLKLAHPNRAKPSFHFINPTLLDLSIYQPELRPILQNFYYQVAASRFAALSNRLLEKKDAPVLIFDACVHHGDTMHSVQAFLKHQGFRNISLGSFVQYPRSNEPARFPIDLDFRFGTNNTGLGCEPYGRSNSLEKLTGRIYVDSARTRAQALAIAYNRMHYRRLIANQHEEFMNGTSPEDSQKV